METKPMTVGELIDYLGAYDEDRFVLIQDSATHYSCLAHCIIRTASMKQVSNDQFQEDENGNIEALILG